MKEDEAGEKEMVAGDDLHRALWHREPVFRYDARRCVQHPRRVSVAVGGERGHDRLCVRTRRARGLLDALCVRQADGQDEALLADDDLRLSSRCTGRSRIGTRRRARLDVGLRSAHHSAHGQGHQKAGKGHDHVLRRLAGGRGQELRHSGGAPPPAQPRLRGLLRGADDHCPPLPAAQRPRDRRPPDPAIAATVPLSTEGADDMEEEGQD